MSKRLADNSQQTWSSDSYQNNTGFVSVLGEGILEWFAPQKDENLLDLGCGDGVLTQKIAESGAHVMGVDASESFINSAQEKGLNATVMDGHALTFDQAFDGVFSNAALHWMLDPEKVIAGVHKALKPNGRFVGEFGGFGNVAAVSAAMGAVGAAMNGDTRLAGPWFFPTVEEYTDMLEKGGFKIERIDTFYRPTPLPKGMRAWLEVMRAPFFAQFGDRLEEAYQRVENALRPSLCDYKGQWFADYVRLRFYARKL